MEFYLVRHGRVHSNDLKIYNGCRIDEDLNAEGIRQAEQTREMLKDTPLDVIVSSSMLRARHTAEIINEGRNLPIVCDERLRERDMGELTGKPWREKSTQSYPEDANVEPPEALLARIFAALNDIVKTYPDKNVLLVSHGGASKAICAFFEGLPEDYSLKSFRLLDNCEVKHYHF